MSDDLASRPPGPVAGVPAPPGTDAERERERYRREIAQLQRLGAARGKILVTMDDAETCEACAVWAGIELALDDTQFELPHAGCTSPLGCRCRWRFVP